MQANQKLEAEAGALRASLQELINAMDGKFADPELIEKLERAHTIVKITDAGKEVAERITGYQEQLKLNTRLIELLRDHRTSLAAQSRVLAPGLNDVLDMLRILLDARTVAVDMKGYRDRYYAVKDSVAAISAHKYADLLSMATRFSLRNDGEGPYIEKSVDDWLISRRGVGAESEDVLWDRVAEAWGIFDHRIEEHFVFPTLEAAFAYVEDHPAVLGLQLIENAPNSVLDNAQPHR